MITDMTQGSPAKILIRFSIPMLLSVAFQQLYNVVDSVVAGKFVSVDALAAVGASYPITMIFMAVATGANIGCSVVISQLFGAKNYGKMKTAVSTSILSIVAVSLILTVSGFLFCTPLMRLLNTPDRIFGDSALYLQVYIGGLIFLFLYNICTGIFTALGDSRTPLYFLIASSLGNIVLDLVFVICFQMGVGGVAWATFIAQGISSILAFSALFLRLRGVPSDENDPLFSWEMLGKISLIAIPSILQQSFISVGNLMIQGLVNSFGPAVIAGYSAAVKLNTFSVTTLTTLGNSISSFSAQNIGANKYERVHAGLRAGILLSIVIVAIFTSLFFFLPDKMIGLFMSEGGEEAMLSGVQFLRVVSPFYIVICLKLVCDGVLRGSGAMLQFMSSTFTDLILRVALAYLLAYLLKDSLGIWLSWPLGWAVAAVMSIWFYCSGSWKKYAVVSR